MSGEPRANRRRTISSSDEASLIQVRRLKVHFTVRKGILRRRDEVSRPVDGIDLDILQGETVGLVGEKGSGKSVAARAMLRLIKPTSGTIQWQGKDLARLSREQMRKLRSQMQMVFADPYAAFNPRMTVAAIVAEPARIQGMAQGTDGRERVAVLLKLVGLNPYLASRYPYEMSGTQRQRLGVARALSTAPALIIADDPASFLDDSLQKQLIQLIDELKEEMGFSCLLLTRDITQAALICDRIAIIHLGRIVETGTRDELLEHPLHPHTQALLTDIPLPDPNMESKRRPVRIDRAAPSNFHESGGCRFIARCPYATEICQTEDPAPRDFGSNNLIHLVACHHAERLE